MQNVHVEAHGSIQYPIKSRSLSREKWYTPRKRSSPIVQHFNGIVQIFHLAIGSWCFGNALCTHWIEWRVLNFMKYLRSLNGQDDLLPLGVSQP